VLVHAAGGGVGHLAVQIAKARGAYVVATASATKHGFVTALGTDEVIDYRAVDFRTVVEDVDVVLDSVGGDTADRSIDVLRPDGLLPTIVGRRDVALAARAKANGRRFASIAVEPDYAGLEALTTLVEAGKLQVHETLPLEPRPGGPAVARARIRLRRYGLRPLRSHPASRGCLRYHSGPDDIEPKPGGSAGRYPSASAARPAFPEPRRDP
jgi:hypothetical protein